MLWLCLGKDKVRKNILCVYIEEKGEIVSHFNDVLMGQMFGVWMVRYLASFCWSESHIYTSGIYRKTKSLGDFHGTPT